MEFKVTISNCKNPITLPLANYNAHPKEVDHFCAGGEVSSDECYEAIKGPKFFPERKYHIKLREPKPGEVWVDSKSRPYVFNADLKTYINLWSNEDLGGWNERTLDYAAPSVKEYYKKIVAQELLDKAEESGDVLDGHYRDTLMKAAGDDNG